MNEKVMRNIRRASNGSVIAAAVCALTGAIGAMITMGILTSGDIKSFEGGMVCTAILITCWDLVRLGGFGIFVGGLLSVAFEIFGGDRNKAYSFVLLGGSIFGFIGSIMLSVESMYKSVMGSALGFSSHYASEAGLISSLTSSINTACVFAIVSAVVAFVAIGIAASAGKNANMYGYAQMPNAVGVNSWADGVWCCPNCGAQNSSSSVMCQNCGKYK